MGAASISETIIHEISRCFSADLTALQTADLTGTNRNTITGLPISPPTPKIPKKIGWQDGYIKLHACFPSPELWHEPFANRQVPLVNYAKGKPRAPAKGPHQKQRIA